MNAAKKITMSDDALRLRSKLKLPACDIEGCKTPASDRLMLRKTEVAPGLYCKTHADMLLRQITRRDYEDFVSLLREQGILEEPQFSDSLDIEGRVCGVPGCKEDGRYGGMNVEPYKTGNVWLCMKHKSLAQSVIDRQNGPRVLRELEYTPRRSDPERLKRRNEIRKACAKHKGKPNYLKLVCRDLQKTRVKMPERWLEAWERLGFRVEPENWFDAYQGNKTARIRIQKYISKAGTLRN